MYCLVLNIYYLEFSRLLCYASSSLSSSMDRLDPFDLAFFFPCTDDISPHPELLQGLW